MDIRKASLAVAFLALQSACGGGSEAPVELTVDADTAAPTSLPYANLTGESFVPAGSNCPPSHEYVVFGTLGPHTISARNATLGLDYPVGDDLWVCNSQDGRVMHWRSNPIDLAPGDNRITVTMRDSQRTSSATVTVTRR
ncbi:MAG: hypothetical protein OEU93_04950 [Rubrivivax sp.]|nr:hypothetical protein [Rubrivivax sp.]